jgi:NAD(P)-dependent dehydrogenase (short-subunit alcohol dehydrogenase family)
MNLEKKIIIVTGGCGLIGKEIINHLTDHNAIAINADISLQTDLNLNQIHLDICNEESILEMIRTVVDRYGKIDGLVNNAYPRTKDWGQNFESISYESWSKNVDFQLNSLFYVTKHCMEFIKESQGSVVNMASIYGVVGNDFTIYEGTSIGTAPQYAAIKGGVINFTRYMASYFGQYNVNINCVSPGGIFDHQDPIFVQNYEKKCPMKRMGTPKDIAPVVTFLLSNEAKYVSGQNIIVDGGWTCI